MKEHHHHLSVRFVMCFAKKRLHSHRHFGDEDLARPQYVPSFPHKPKAHGAMVVLEHKWQRLVMGALNRLVKSPHMVTKEPWQSVAKDTIAAANRIRI